MIEKMHYILIDFHPEKFFWIYIDSMISLKFYR